MAVTTVPANLVQKCWAKETWNCGVNESFFNKFMGKGSDSIIQIREELKKDAGDQITIPLRMPLAGAGVLGDNVLEGNEEAMQLYDFGVQINQIRNAVKLKGKMEEKKSSLNLRNEAKTALKEWYSMTLDKMFFNSFVASPSTRRVIYAGTATSEVTVKDVDKMTCEVISKAKRMASKQATFGPTIVPKIRPVMVDGKSMYLMLMSFEQFRDLKSDPVWVDAQKNANVRGMDNPIFSGAEGVYDGVAIYTHELVPVTATGATGANVGHALLLGAQAGVMAVGSEPFWEEELTDYKNSIGFAVGSIIGIAKSKFNNEDFATIQIMTGNKAD